MLTTPSRSNATTFAPTAILMLALIAGGCAGHRAGSRADHTTATDARSTAPNTAPGMTSTKGDTAPADKNTAPAATPGPGHWVAVIDGKEVPAPRISMGDDATVMRI